MANLPYDAANGEDLYDGTKDFNPMDDQFDPTTPNPLVYEAGDAADVRDMLQYIRGAGVIGNAKAIWGKVLDSVTVGNPNDLDIIVYDSASGKYKAQAGSVVAKDTLKEITDADFTSNIYTVNAADLGKLFVVDISGAAVAQTIKMPDATAGTKGYQTGINYFDGTVRLDVTTVGGTQSIGNSTTQSFNKDAETLTLTDNETSYLIRQDSRINKSGVDVIAWNDGVTSVLDLEDETAHFFSSGRLTGSAITKGASTVDVAEGQWYLRNADNDDAPLKPALVSATTGIAIPDGQTNYIIADYNGGTPIHSLTSDITAIPCQSKCVDAVVSRVNSNIDVMDLGGYTNDFMAKFMRASAVTGWLEYGGGLMLSEIPARQISITAGALYIGVERFTTPSLDTSVAGTFTTYYQDGAGGWTEIASSTQINITQYDNGTGTLATGAVNKYYIHSVYARVNTPTEFAVVMPQVAYNSLADAQAAAGPLSTVPAFGDSFSTGRFIGSIITKYNTTAFEDILSPFTTVLGSTTATNHNNLSGLQGGATSEYYHLTAAEYATIAYTEATAFNDGNLSSGVLTITHNLGVQHALMVTIEDDIGNQIIPDEITYTSTTALTVDLSSYGSLTGTWYYRVRA